MDLNDDELLRYSRQIMLPQIGIEGQDKILEAKVLLFGAGGLGSPVAMYLAASGVGELTIVDPDAVDLSNLQRQILHNTVDLGKDKVLSAKQTLRDLNPQTSVRTIKGILAGESLEQEIFRTDVVVDATDNFQSRFAINAACVKSRTALITGAAIRFEGQVCVFDMQESSACYQCLFPDIDAGQTELEESCADTGILGSVTGLIGSIQATEVIKLLVNVGRTLSNRLLLIDALNMEWNSVKIKKDSKCVTCSS
ncbi:MAG: molybdopterin-synthase adenylyltransferase MoeB [Gammaproteobacteria bacterium]